MFMLIYEQLKFWFRSKKALELPMSVIVVMIILIALLVFMLLFFMSQGTGLTDAWSNLWRGSINQTYQSVE